MLNQPRRRFPSETRNPPPSLISFQKSPPDTRSKRDQRLERRVWGQTVCRKALLRILRDAVLLVLNALYSLFGYAIAIKIGKFLWSIFGSMERIRRLNGTSENVFKESYCALPVGKKELWIFALSSTISCAGFKNIVGWATAFVSTFRIVAELTADSGNFDTFVDVHTGAIVVAEPKTVTRTFTAEADL